MVSNLEKLHCVERELAFRFRVYDRLVVRGKMTKQEQEREIELMSAIVEDYRALASADEPEFAMFIETRRTVKEGRPVNQTATTTYNKSVDLLTMPDSIKQLPISPLGWPVPWFVTWFDREGEPCEDREGIPDFRVINPAKMVTAVKKNRCWVCGQTKSAVFHAFVIGPMCAINKIISEPSSHKNCAIYAARVCPFLAKPNMVRNEKGMYSEDGTLLRGLGEAAGVGLEKGIPARSVSGSPKAISHSSHPAVACCLLARRAGRGVLVRGRQARDAQASDRIHRERTRRCRSWRDRKAQTR